MPDDDRQSYGRGSGTTYGYVAEWRLKPESALLEELLPYHDVGKEWKQANYTIEQLHGMMSEAAKHIVHPVIERDFMAKELADQGLVRRDVAIAIIACLRTRIKPNLLPHIEWRIVRIKFTRSYEKTRDDDGNTKAEENMTEISRMLSEER